MKKIMIAALIAIATVTAQADVVVQVTATNRITNVPGDFGAPHFVLDKPWFVGQLPGFLISSVPTTDTLTVDPGFNNPGLSITDHVPPNNGLIWYYYCDGLTFNYSSTNPTATVVFTGKIDAQAPGGGVQCTCIGSACSTTTTVPARFVME